jgi:phosphonopyruvate decarboxylase
MINASDLFSFLIKNKIKFFTGVPDSLLKNFNYILDINKKKISHIITANEGSAIALAAGNYLATKKIPLVYMQNSGLGNAINPLISICHSKVYSIPLILMIGWRGAPNENDEPQHQLKGKITPSILKLLDIKFSVLENLSDLKKIQKLLNYSKNKKRPVAFLLKNNTLQLKSNIKKNIRIKNYFTREFVINELLYRINKNTRIVSTTGYTSRELFQIRKDKKYKNGKDFYMVGGMGHSAMISLGYSLNTKKQVVCLDGDGSLLMHMGSLISTGLKAKSNFKHILLNNGAHESVGNQKIDTKIINLKKIIYGFGYKHFYFAKNKKNFLKNLNNFLKKSGPSFFEIQIDIGNIKNLGRPKNLIKVKKNFISDDD